jgi:DNA-binding NtrC family response regulator
LQDLPPPRLPAAADPKEVRCAMDHWPTLADVEEKHVRKTLQETFFNQSAAARMLGIDRKSLARKIKKYSIELPKVSGMGRSPT